MGQFFRQTIKLTIVNFCLKKKRKKGKRGRTNLKRKKKKKKRKKRKNKLEKEKKREKKSKQKKQVNSQLAQIWGSFFFERVSRFQLQSKPLINYFGDIVFFLKVFNTWKKKKRYLALYNKYNFLN